MTLASSIEINRRSTPEQIARGLSRLVLSGELPPGRPLRESVIAAELGVSRNTVREAVRLLERSGLVRYELNRGAVVREPSQADLEDVYHARLAIEVGAAYTAKDGDPAVKLVNEALDRLRAALASGDVEAAITADLDFHATLVSSAGSARLDAAFAPVLNELRLYLTILSTADEYEDVERITAEHVVIAEAFASGDRRRLASEISEHILTNAARVAAILERSGS
jgi:DNA-binding GntR family transcriptional regulator